jgi:hypothetical protein
VSASFRWSARTRVLAASLEKVAQEEQINVDTAAGTLPVDQMGFGEPEVIGD